MTVLIKIEVVLNRMPFIGKYLLKFRRSSLAPSWMYFKRSVIKEDFGSVHVE